MMNEDHILKAIRNGSLGRYGKTFKLSTQEICIWIREYADDNDIDLETKEEKFARKTKEANRF